ncbi:transcriptional regulator, GntR family [Coriobacterium glomerans PW2]|uniref:Transcriptional regulator, GntR family n=1 Tax=Coriobacterium glomerans (strain ATCC 49209 / DSM 20642 / JCM 10262 / PW2) TaxID=700015 RepID=F2N797_CORGP|nr:GntR family transcriptional regulator [Coriobacterium glomerans]AEB06572.1 transcriptional regulator, GntR family [Coriobacterium glomerans PW2]
MENCNERSKPMPLYQIVKNDLRQKIITGALHDGECLPTERELAKQYGYSLSTIRKGIELLVEEDLLIKIRGTGTFVTLSQVFASKRSALLIDMSDLSQLGPTTAIRILSCGTVEASPTICRQLRLPEQSAVQQIERLIMVDDAPRAIEVVYGGEEQLPNLFISLTENVSIARVLRRYGMTNLTTDLTLHSTAATPEEAKQLSYISGGPTFSLDLRYLLQDDHPVAFSTMIWRADSMSFHAKIDAGGQLL